jgi:hypothetical protein
VLTSWLGGIDVRVAERAAGTYHRHSVNLKRVVQRNCDPARFTPCLFHTQLRAGYNTYVILFL